MVIVPRPTSRTLTAINPSALGAPVAVTPAGKASGVLSEGTGCSAMIHFLFSTRVCATITWSIFVPDTNPKRKRGPAFSLACALGYCGDSTLSLFKLLLRGPLLL